jgi:hypothetical protein
MNDAEYLFRQDIRDKKSSSRGAFHKKNGAKSKKCKLPSDYLTRKEKSKLNSEVQTYNMSKFYSYSEFKGMPLDLQVEYLNNLIDKYGVSFSAIATDLFNVSKTSLRSYCVKKGVYDKIKMRVHHAGCRKGKDLFKLAILDAVPTHYTVETSEPVVDQIVDTVEEKVPEVEPVSPVRPLEESTPFAVPEEFHLQDLILDMDGFDLETFSFLAYKYSNKKVHLTLSVSVDNT